MSDGSEDKIAERLTRLQGTPKPARRGVNPWLIGSLGVVTGLAGGIYVMATAPTGPEPAKPVPTSTAAEFGSGGLDGFTFVRKPEPEAPTAPPQDSAEVRRLTALVNELTAKIAEMEANPTTVAVADEEAMRALRDQLAGITDELAAREEALRQAEEETARLEREKLQAESELATERAMAGQRAAEAQALADQKAELERRRAEAEALRQAQIHSGMVAFRASGGGSSGSTTSEAQERFIGDDAFLRASAKPVETRQSEVIANPAHTVVQGTVIEAALETAINSDLPGVVSAVVSQDVWSFDMTRVLIPRGSKLFGRYNSDVGVGQKRILIAWNRIITTDGQSVELAAYGSDRLGRAGLPAKVRSHFLAKFGSAALLSIIGAAPDYAAAQSDNDATADVIKAVGGGLENATDTAIGDYLSIPPTLSTDQGAIVMIRVDADVEFY